MKSTTSYTTADRLFDSLKDQTAGMLSPTPSDAAPLTVTLPPRIAAAVRLEALQCNSSVEEHLLYALADMHRDNVVYFEGDERKVLWLTEGTCAEGRARAEFNRAARRMARRGEVAS